MPRKIKQLMAELRQAGFVELARRGKGSHSVWKYPARPDVFAVTLAGQAGEDAHPYQERAVREAIAQVKGQGDHER